MRSWSSINYNVDRSDLPKRTSENNEVFDSEEIVLTLHDEGPDGLLFKMATW